MALLVLTRGKRRGSRLCMGRGSVSLLSGHDMGIRETDHLAARKSCRSTESEQRGGGCRVRKGKGLASSCFLLSFDHELRKIF
jgi:hypothetical protein